MGRKPTATAAGLQLSARRKRHVDGLESVQPCILTHIMGDFCTQTTANTENDRGRSSGRPGPKSDSDFLRLTCCCCCCFSVMAAVLAWGWALGSLMCELQGKAGRRISASLRCGSRASVCSFSHRPLGLLASHCLAGPSGFSYFVLLFQRSASSFFLLLFSLVFISIIGMFLPCLSFTLFSLGFCHVH